MLSIIKLWLISSSLSSAFGITGQIIRDEGLLGLFRGFTPTLAREMPGYFFFFGGYEASRFFLTDGQPEKAGMQFR